ncbi:L,D-transpeptidase family protein [Streptomyces sp. NPDC006879]|uniref:L,D-transpeptidase family protein n=1 Tax=Streptomyces sp. NPDC006879 TaxID=3364767 RepID=UPI00368F4F1C
MHRTSVVARSLLAATTAVLLTAGCSPRQGAPAASGTAADHAGKPVSDARPTPPAESAPAAPAAGPGPSRTAAATATAVSPSNSPAASPAPSTKSSDDAKPAERPLMARGAETEQVRELQARLRQVGHFERSPTGFYGAITSRAVASFQSKRELAPTGTVDGRTWRALVAMTHRPTVNELRPATTNELDAPDPRCMTGRVLCVSKESRTLAWMIDGTVVAAMDVRFGSENTPTREGVFQVGWKRESWTSTIYHTSMPYSMFFSGGQAVHYSADFAARGYAGASHGCVNVRDLGKLKSVFAQVRVGDRVVVHW